MLRVRAVASWVASWYATSRRQRLASAAARQAGAERDDAILAKEDAEWILRESTQKLNRQLDMAHSEIRDHKTTIESLESKLRIKEQELEMVVAMEASHRSAVDEIIAIHSAKKRRWLDEPLQEPKDDRYDYDS